MIGQLATPGRVKQEDITVYDPATEHHYQPGYTSVAGGVYFDEELTRKHVEPDLIVKS